ncbi:MAG TPA: hypothetical protein VN784_00145 [Candidatus Limnocylindrales bacterium]|nr:hypothetical protein [Candidatus Limnocylindrales bacterium]
MKTRCGILRLMMAGCVIGLALPSRVAAEVSDADFNALKETVQKLGEQVQNLQQSNIVQRQTHAQDLLQIQQLQQKLTETQQIATNAEQKSIEASMTQPMPRQPIDEATVNHNFMMLGDAEFQYAKIAGQHGAFLQADFAPIFLYRGGDNILFEAGFDTTLANNAPGSSGYTTTFNLSFAQLDYVMNDYMTFAGGELILPLGTYTERGAGWLNKIPDNPLAVDALLPGTGLGVEMRGGIPVGDTGQSLNYEVYVVNGPGSSDTTGTSGSAGNLDLGGNVGVLSDGSTVANLHGHPSGGARLGYFVPFKPHYDLELGVSGQSGEWDDAGNHLWSAGVLDAALHLGPAFEAKGEYIVTRYGSDDIGTHYQQGWFVQAGYKLAGLDLELPIINNLEIVGRYDSLHDVYDPADNAFDIKTRRYTVGYVYYFTNTLLFEGDYEFLNSNDPSQADQFILQLSLGF